MYVYILTSGKLENALGQSNSFQNLLGGLARRSIYCQAPVHVKFHVNISQAPPVPGPEGDCGLDTRGPGTEAALAPHSYPHSQTVRVGVE